MLAIKTIVGTWFLLATISEIYSSEYLHFGGTEEESRQAEYYLSADSGANTEPTDELTRTQRSFWKLLKHGLFGECGNCCNKCNYNVRNGNNCNSGPSLLFPFQPWRPLPLWRPLEPLLDRLSYDNYETSNYAYGNSNKYGNTPCYGMGNYNDNGINTIANYDDNEPPASVNEIPQESQPTESGYQVDNSLATDEIYSSETPINSNIPTPKDLQQPNKKMPQIIYQPIIYVSPQYQENKSLNRAKQEETKFAEEYKNEKPHLPDYKIYPYEEFKKPLHSSNVDKIKSDENSYNFEKTTENEIPTAEKPSSQTFPRTKDPASKLSYLPTSPSVSSVSAVYNIITPALLHSISSPNTPCSDADTSKYLMHSSNYLPLDNYSSKFLSNLVSLSSPPEEATTHPASIPLRHTHIQPVKLTLDDQPYRACPELFKDYQRTSNTFLPSVHDANKGLSD